MSRRVKTLIGAMAGLAIGAALGWAAGAGVRSDNAPFFVALGALIGMWGGLVWARALWPLVLAAIGLLAVLVIAVLFTPPRAPFEAPSPAPATVTSSARRPDGLSMMWSAVYGKSTD